MSRGLLKLYKADIVWSDEDFDGASRVIVAVPDRYYEEWEIPEELDVRVFFYLDPDLQPVAPENFGDFTVTKFSDDYEEAWFEIEEKEKE